jgi:hypothetical protein
LSCQQTWQRTLVCLAVAGHATSTSVLTAFATSQNGANRFTSFKLMQTPRWAIYRESTIPSTPIDILWALNAHHDPTGMFPDGELTEAALQHKTQPPTQPPEVTQPLSRAHESETRTMTAHTATQRFDRSTRNRRRAPKNQPPPKQHVNQQNIKVSDIFLAAMNLEAGDRLTFSVPKGSVLRVMKTHQMDRILPKLNGKLGLGRERSVACLCF